ncbi:MAG: hypothetical protein A2047_02380 [Omnitrophica bacterium GWA2_41_15]|nr:MAG: hypothetical protein A2047_02380 [Omnitrophica bacterium GWA2_41_15]HAZ10559.1 hypothetical protein [Candidatus Omnitrophota bacterium]
MFSDNVLIIFVKYPRAGFVKTRLAKEIGRKNASELYRLFVKTILSRIKDKNFTRVIFYSPASKRNEIKRWLGGEILYPQKGKDLGERLLAAFRLTFQKGAKKVVAIGTDSPALNKKLVLDAFEKLKDTECVLGPAFDGGYYLVGLSSFYKEIFQHIDWGSYNVFKQTLGTIKKLRVRFSLLEKVLDIDNKDDLLNFCRQLPKIYKANPIGLTPIIKFLEQLFS